MGVFGSPRGTDESLPRTDRGAGSLNDYDYGLRARNRRVTIMFILSTTKIITRNISTTMPTLLILCGEFKCR